MKLKTGIVLAIIAVVIKILVQAYLLSSNLQRIGEHSDLAYRNFVMSTLGLISYSMMLPFFIILYQNQKSK